jgi:aminomethyltransferase
MRAAGPPRKLVGIRMESKIVPREGYPVMRDGTQIGTVSSGVYSPLLECGIAFAFVETKDAGLNKACDITVRGKNEAALVVSKRFLQSA